MAVAKNLFIKSQIENLIQEANSVEPDNFTLPEITLFTGRKDVSHVSVVLAANQLKEVKRIKNQYVDNQAS